MSEALPVLLLLGILGAGYLKMGLVLAVLRHALGGILPLGAVALLSLLLSAVVTAPLAERAQRAMAARGDPEARLQAGLEPLRNFLRQHAPARERATALEVARRVRPPEERGAVGEEDLSVLAPAFALAELKRACQIGFLLLLPFLVLDLLVAALLQGLGLPGLPAAAVSLPFKLLLLVLSDGWRLLAQGLLLGYA
ncbi:MAG: EscR/YscR/HrcR family type III secretion system export apparatus protein [Myxococcales bacterium]|nr:EscR/YscR/HrcR family type III secretion system export apparatus protein [Myxococcota bacterium]MDW8281568.1 EscR/YscR/HrcR family type III secretion system export apparatus protein [Myxococcales bacterium]